MYKPPPEKTVRISTSNIPLPHWLGNILVYFTHSVRSTFIKSGSKVEAFFILPTGQPMRTLYETYSPLLEPTNMTKLIPEFIKKLFPDVYITPQDFRRMIPSALFEHDIHEEGKTVKHTLISLSQLINTSEKVTVKF